MFIQTDVFTGKMKKIWWRKICTDVKPYWQNESCWNKFEMADFCCSYLYFAWIISFCHSLFISKNFFLIIEIFREPKKEPFCRLDMAYQLFYVFKSFVQAFERFLAISLAIYTQHQKVTLKYTLKFVYR